MKAYAIVILEGAGLILLAALFMTVLVSVLYPAPADAYVDPEAEITDPVFEVMLAQEYDVYERPWWMIGQGWCDLFWWMRK